MKILKNGKLAIAISIIFSIALIASSLTFAQGYGPRKGMRGGGWNQQGGGYGWNQQAADNRQAFRTEMYNARIQVLAELTDESEADIKAKIRYKPMWAVLDEYKVDYSKFNKKMTEKRAEVIKKAVADGKITQEHADFMLERSVDGMGPGMGPGFKQGRRGNRGGPRGFNGDCPRF